MSVHILVAGQPGIADAGMCAYPSACTALSELRTSVACSGSAYVACPLMHRDTAYIACVV